MLFFIFHNICKQILYKLTTMLVYLTVKSNSIDSIENLTFFTLNKITF